MLQHGDKLGSNKDALLKFCFSKLSSKLNVEELVLLHQFCLKFRGNKNYITINIKQNIDRYT